jgi:DNA polymerase
MTHVGYSPEQLQHPTWWNLKPLVKGSHHPLRKKVGKIMELACLSPDTQVLTDRGYVCIVDVSVNDKLWDGESWVKHKGVVSKGTREVIDLDGVKMTPDHLVNTGRLWKEARELVLSASTLSRALGIGSENLPWRASNSGKREGCGQFKSDALAAQKRTPSCLATSCGERLRGVTSVLRKNLKRFIGSYTRNTRTSSQMTTTGGDYSTDYLPRVGGVTALKIKRTSITGEGGLRFVQSGAKTKAHFSDTFSRWKAGTSLIWRWIEQTLTGTTSLVTFDSSAAKKTCSTDEKSLSCKTKSESFKTESPSLSDVYDIMNAGPRNRFTIKTNSGHLIVHNCGYQGWVGSMKAFGAEEFMTEPEMKDAILAWRKASPAIVEFWGGQERNWQPELYGTEGCFVWAFQNPNHVARLSSGLEFRSDGQRVFIKLLSGRELTYHNVRLTPSARREGTLTISYEGNNTNPKNGKVGWIRMETWGGRLVENIVQATARDIQWFGIVNLEKAGYPIVLHVYDEDVAEVPKGWGSVEEFEAIMSTMPPWAADWPIKAKGGWRKERYGK